MVFFQVVFGAEVFFVLWVLGRRAWQAANEVPETAQKLKKLRVSMPTFRGNKNSVPDTGNRVDGV